MTADALRSDYHASHLSTIAAFASYPSKQYIQTDVAPYAMTSPIPDWLGSAKAKLAEFGRLEPGWNSYEAKSISAVARTAAYDLLRQLASTRTPRPTLVPTSDGLVQIEWHTRGVDLEIRVLSSTKISISFEDSRGALSPIEGEFQYDMEKLGAAMQVLSNR